MKMFLAVSNTQIEKKSIYCRYHTALKIWILDGQGCLLCHIVRLWLYLPLNDLPPPDKLLIPVRGEVGQTLRQQEQFNPDILERAVDRGIGEQGNNKLEQ